LAGDQSVQDFERDGIYTTLLMSTGLTFGTISALFGLTNHVITQQQCTILMTTVIGSATVPTLIAQRLFQPDLPPVERTEEDVEVLSRLLVRPRSLPGAGDVQ